MSAQVMECSPVKLDAPAPLVQMDDEAASLALAMRLQEEDHAYAQTWGGGLWLSPTAQDRQEQSPEDEESLALAIRLQQEEDDAQLRATLGLGDGDEVPGSPSNYTHEQLLRLSETVGTVSRGASREAIDAFRRFSVADSLTVSGALIGEQV